MERGAVIANGRSSAVSLHERRVFSLVEDAANLHLCPIGTGRVLHLQLGQALADGLAEEHLTVVVVFGQFLLGVLERLQKALLESLKYKMNYLRY